MRPKQIQMIAEMLTDDPDIFCEDGMAGNISKSAPAPPTTSRAADSPAAQPTPEPGVDKPLNATEVRQQASDATGGNEESADVVANQMKMQQDMEKQQQVERKKVLDPQFDELNQAMSGLQQGVLQGKQATTSGGEQFGALEKEMTSLNTLLGNIQKQV